MNTFASIKNWNGCSLIPDELTIDTAVNKLPIQGDEQNGFALSTPLENYDQKRINNAKEVLLKLSEFGGIRWTETTAPPALEIAQFPSSAYGSRSLEILENLINPTQLPEPTEEEKLLKSRETFKTEEVSAFLVRNALTGRLLAKPRLLHTVCIPK